MERNDEDTLRHFKTELWNQAYRTQDVELQIYRGQFAIVDGTGIASAYTYRSSNVLIKEDGAWRALASHISGVAERSPA